MACRTALPIPQPERRDRKEACFIMLSNCPLHTVSTPAFLSRPQFILHLCKIPYDLRLWCFSYEARIFLKFFFFFIQYTLIMFPFPQILPTSLHTRLYAPLSKQKHKKQDTPTEMKTKNKQANN